MKVCRNCGKKTNVDTEFICSYCKGPLKTVKSNPFTDKRYGMFNIRLEILGDFYDEIMGLLKDVFIVKAEFLYANSLFVFTGVSNKFRKSEPGQPLDVYSLMYNPDEHKYYFERVKMNG